MDLNSINYLHFGKFKLWYGIPTEDADKFDALTRRLYPEHYKECSEFIRHKNFHIHPEILLKNGIKVFKCIQNAGEFVVTQGKGYHGGFNAG